MAKVDNAYPVVTPEEAAKRKAIIANQDPSRFIFPAGQAAPSGIAPAAPVELTPEQAAQEALNFPSVANRGPAIDQAQEEFVNQESSQAAQAAQDPSQSIAGKYANSLNMESAAQENLGKQESEVLARQSEMINKNIQEAQALQQKNDNELAEIETERKVAQNDLDSKKIEPHGFFHNKSGWEKVIGGIGLFLGSITPEGARNVAAIVTKEIERDTESQKLDYQLRKGKVDAISNRYKANIDKYKDDQLARLAMQREKLLATDYQLKGLQAAAKGPMARAKAEAGKAEIEMKIAEVEQKMFERKQKSGIGTISGYTGSNPNASISKDVYDRSSAADSASATISELEKLSKQGAAMPLTERNKKAKLLRTKLSADLAKAMFGRSSDTELEVAMELIPDITSMTQTKGIDQSLFKTLRNRLNSDVESYARKAGYTKNAPLGRKL